MVNVTALRLLKDTKHKCRYCGQRAEAILLVSSYFSFFHESYFMCLDCVEEYSEMIYGSVSAPKGFIFDGFLNN